MREGQGRVHLGDSASFQGSWDCTAPQLWQPAPALAPPGWHHCRGLPGLLWATRVRGGRSPGIEWVCQSKEKRWLERGGRGQRTYWPQGPRAAFLFSGPGIMEVTLIHSWAQAGPQRGTSGGQWASGVGSTWAQRCPMNTHLLGSDASVLKPEQGPLGAVTRG